MGSWTTQRWVPSFDAPSRAGQRGGAYRAYLPDELVTRPVVLSVKLAVHAAEVESRVRALSVAPETRALEGLARFLLPDEQHRRQRTVQNWIGGNDWHPLDAQFVPHRQSTSVR